MSSGSVEEYKLAEVNIGANEVKFDLGKEKMSLARSILFFIWLSIALIFVISFVPDGYFTGRAQSVADNIIQSSIPIASLVIGYYFGKDG